MSESGDRRVGAWCSVPCMHVHDHGLVHGSHTRALVGSGVGEGVVGDLARGGLGDDLDALHRARHDLVLDAAVLSLGVLTDHHDVDILVARLDSVDASARTHVGKEIKLLQYRGAGEQSRSSAIRKDQYDVEPLIVQVAS